MLIARERMRATPWIVSGLLVIHAGLVLGGIWQNFVAIDEVGHVPSGVSHWQTGTFLSYRVNPPLARMIATLPVLAMDAPIDATLLDTSPGARPEWALGRRYSEVYAARYLNLVRAARLAGVAWSVLGAWIAFVWSRELYGDRAGCLACAIWCFEPTILTFAQLAVPDLPAAVACLGATYAFRRYLLAPGRWTAAVAGAILGVALLTKFTLLVLYVAWPLAWLIGRWGGGAEVRRTVAGAGTFFRHFVLMTITSLLVINAGYAFRGSGTRLGDFRFVSRTLGGERGLDETSANRFAGTILGRLPVPVPTDYVAGIDIQRRDFEAGLPSYLRGEWRDVGWWYYYLYAMSVKLPLGLLALVVLNFALMATRCRDGPTWFEESILLIPAAAILGLVSSQTGFNHHLRYVLPAFPFILVSTSRSGIFLSRATPRAAVAVAVLAGWAITSCLAAYPHTLSYFNEAAGGAEGGRSHLADSNVDWGQDLLRLRRWLGDHPEARPIHVAYFQLVDPALFGEEFRGYRLPPPGPVPGLDYDAWEQGEIGPLPGYYAVSANYLTGAIFAAPDGQGGLRSINRHDYFRYFRSFRPIARCGPSIDVFKIDRDDANRVRTELGLLPLP